MRTEKPVTVYRKDYQPYPYDIPEVALTFDLDPDATTVHSTLVVARKADIDTAVPMVLDGIELELVSIHVNGCLWSTEHYSLDDTSLTLLNLPSTSTIDIVSRCRPSANSALMGLYVSGGNFFTQCEAEGFRRITWFADRPDVMSRFKVTLRATSDYPILLSNGNLLSTQQLPDGRQEAQWEDPFLKPSYLFALVAGRFTHRETTVTTSSGRSVLLQVYSDPGSEDRTEWALESLVRALRWDETRFGLELDLDRFMIVAVSDFNMGAMENKGLNIFNAAYVLADPQTATDANYEDIEAVIGHEYFHNWTGNRVTCRDWFQLSLKEGLTVFRDQEFTADMMARDLDAGAAASARAVKRIDDVVTLRAAQFPEDAGPMAHPIRPDSYEEIGNFYTSTVYEKGSEVIRMQHTLLGAESFREGIDEYFRRHDGQAVTCDDFVAAMESVYSRRNPGRDLSVFRRWYQQAGTPRVTVNLAYDALQQECEVTLSQQCPPVGVEKRASPDVVKAPFHIPFALGLLDAQGRALPLRIQGTDGSQATVLLELTEECQTWVFKDIPSKPIPSLLRGFSAPVTVAYNWSNEELALLSAHDSDPFARWEAGQELATRHILALAQQHQAGLPLHVDTSFIRTWHALLTDPDLDAGYRARALALPSEKTLAERQEVITPIAIASARDAVRIALGKQLADQWITTVNTNQTPGTYSPAPGPAGKRALKNLALNYLAASGAQEALSLAKDQFEQSHNMTDSMAALSVMVNYAPTDIAAQALETFYTRWQDNPLVVDKWFMLQATAQSMTVQRVRELMKHPAFTLRNPNRARALVFQFCLNNPRAMHLPDGSGYTFWAEQVLALDALNPEIAARLARGLDNWARFTPELRTLMHVALERVRNHPTLSRNVLEIVSKALELAA